MHFGDLGHLAIVVRAPHLTAISGVDKIGFNRYMVSVLHDASGENRAYLKCRRDFGGIILSAFEVPGSLRMLENSTCRTVLDLSSDLPGE